MKRAFLVAGLAWGDEGKGATVDYLTWKHNADLVVRYNGGSQAGHNVVTPDGRHHTFQQFGSGMFHPGVRTHLSRFMLINPMNMMREEEHLREVGITDAWQRTTVDPRALIITPFHREYNRLQSPQGTNSCGHGIGVCRNFHSSFGDMALFAGDLMDEKLTRKKLVFLQANLLENATMRGLQAPQLFQDEHAISLFWNNWYKDWRDLGIIAEPNYLEHVVKRHRVETVIFEGAQGVLLDETHGEDGFNTWTDCTFNNAYTLLEEAGFGRRSAWDGECTRVGVIRTYYTRHGAGPFPTEDPAINFPEPHNEDASYQGKFRRGKFDHQLFHKAVGILGGYDMLALNHMDQRILRGTPTDKPVLMGVGPTYKDREEL